MMKIIDQTEETITACFNDMELVAMNNALNESLEIPEDLEFQTRMGVTPDKARTLLRQFRKYFGSGGIQ